jgi:PadR family transcriptional regulator, regulatory protein AphA
VYFWRLPHTQLYDESARLEQLGLLLVRHENEGRRRRTYSITDVGLASGAYI